MKNHIFTQGIYFLVLISHSLKDLNILLKEHKAKEHYRIDQEHQDGYPLNSYFLPSTRSYQLIAIMFQNIPHQF